MNRKTIIMLTIVMITLTGTAIASDWQQFQRDETNNGLTDSPAPTEYPELAWSAFTFTNGLGIDVTPIIAGDMAYIFAANGSIWAFDKANGDLIWKNETTGGTLQTSTPAYGDGKLFVAANSGDIFAFDATTGEELWNVHATDRNFECPITYFDHRIYLGEGLSGGVATKYYYCYDESGTEIWSHAIVDTAGFLWNGASVAGDYLVFATHEGELISVYRNNGTRSDAVDLASDLSFSRADLGRIRASVTYHDGYLYMTSEDGQPCGYIFKVRFENGMFLDDGWSTPNGFSTSTPVVYNGSVYVGQGEHGFTGNLTCLDDSTGEILWSYPVDAGVKSSPAVSVQDGEPYIYFTGAKTNGLLYCLKGDGTLAWDYNPPDNGYILQGAAISDGLIYFGTDGGYIYCLKEKFGMPPGYWTPDQNITSGLPDGITRSSPTIFERDGVVYLISGADDGTFHGWNWTGSTWQEDDSIVSGLGDVGNESASAVFFMDGTWYLIAGRKKGFDGFNWTDPGSTWQEDDSIVSGLLASYIPEEINYLNKPVVFYKDLQWYLISGNMPEWTVGSWDREMKMFGHRWNGSDSAWEDSGIVSGLPSRRLDHSAPAVFYVNEEWHLISGSGSGGFLGWIWAGSWRKDDSLTIGLRDVGDRSTPAVVCMNETWYLISGNSSGGFSGFCYMPSRTIPPDLTPTSLEPTTFAVNQTSCVTVTVNNIGGDAREFNLSLKLDEDLICEKTIDLIGAGEEKIINFTFTPESGGTFNMTATVDPENVLSELNEGNNVIVETVFILRPDLIPISLEPSILFTNETNTITATVRNDGEIAAPSFNLLLKIDSELVGTEAIDSLDVGEEKSINVTYTPTSPGIAFDLTVTVDPANAVEESDETNNNLTIQAETNMIWYVYEGESIRDAISNAADYDVIIVYPGTYTETPDAYRNIIVIDKSLTLKGINHPVIDACGAYYCITLREDDTAVQGFKIINMTGEGTGIWSGTEGNNILIEDNIIGPCQTGIRLGGQNNIIRRNIVSNVEWGVNVYGENIFFYLNDFTNGTNETYTALSYNGDNFVDHSPSRVTYVYEGETYINYLGNYWEAYTGTDSDGNGIGDTPYLHDHGMPGLIPDSCDNYPLMQPHASYTLLDDQPDLTVGSIATHGAIYTDAMTVVTAKVSNTGTMGVTAFDVALYSDAALVEMRTVESLSGGTTTSVTFEWTPAVAGDVTLTVVADAADVITELDENNNELTRGVTVKESFNWQEFQKDAMCTGKTNSIAPIANITLRWSRSTNGIGVTPIVANGKTFVIDADEYAWAFDSETGDVLWNILLEEGPGSTLATPAYADGKVFIATRAGYVYALDESSGDIIWSGKLAQDDACCTQICYDGGRIYLGGQGGEYYCLNSSGNGAEPDILWNETSDDYGFDCLSKGSVVGDFFVYGSTKSVVRSVYKENGTLVDEINLSTEYGVDAGSIMSGIVYDGAHIYLTSLGGYLYSIEFDHENGIFGSGRWNAAIGRTSSTPVIHDGMVYVGSESGFYALYASSGSVAWNYVPDGSVSGSPAISLQEEPYIYFATNKTSGSVYCLDRDGNEMWSYEAGRMQQSIAIANGKVYAATDAGLLYCLDEKAPPSDEWAQFHKDYGHTGYSNSAAPNTNTVLWVSSDIGAVPSSSTAIADEKVFVNCGDLLKALDEYTGAVLWETPIEGNTEYESWITPSYHDGKVFISGGQVYSINSEYGTVLWDYELPKPACNGGTLVADGKVFAGDWDGHHYYCLDEQTGAELWSITIDGNSQGVPAFADDRVFLTSWVYVGGHIYCVDADTGAVIWHQTTELDTCGSPVIADGIVYVTTYDFYSYGGIYALNATDGTILWNQTIQRTDSTPAVADGYVYVTGGCKGFSDIQTYCFDATTGELLWETEASDEIGGWTCSVAVADGKVFVGKHGDFFEYDGTYALDSATGDVIWSCPDGGSSPAVANGMLITIGGGRVYAFRSANVASCDATGSEKDAFCPGETVYVSGVGLSPDADYWIWIQNDGVCEGDTLVAGDDPSISQERVTTDINGDFEPIPIWTIPEGAATTHHEYDIVIDDGNNVYITSDDGIDSLGTAGFTAPVPELSGIILVAIGLVVLIGFVRQGGGRKK